MVAVEMKRESAVNQSPREPTDRHRSDPPLEPDPLFEQGMHELLGQLGEEADDFAISRFLRARMDPELARRAALLVALRRRSWTRFRPDHLPYLTAKGLEQATPQVVAEFRARRIHGHDPSCRVIDATCGIGSDSVALVRQGLAVISFDRDQETVRCARRNLELAGGDWSCQLADTTVGALPEADFVLLDPDRRAAGRRSRDPRTWSPTLRDCLEIASRFRGAILRLPPTFEPDSLADESIPAGTGTMSWVSWKGELVEVDLWTGALTAATPGPREAVALDRQGRLSRIHGEPRSTPPLAADAARQINWLAEPDPAVIRSGLLGNLAARIGMAPLDAQIAYLGGAEAEEPGAVDPGLLRCYRVLGCVSLDPRKVRGLLRRHDIGPLTVKKRGHPEPADRLARRLRGRGSKRGLLAVTRIGDRHLAYLLDETPSASSSTRS